MIMTSERLEHARDTGFESALAEAGACLLGGPLQTLDVASRRVLSRVVDMLSLDFATLWRVDPADGRLRWTHRVTAAGAPGAVRDTECPRLQQRLRGDGSPMLLLSRGDD